MQTSPTGLPSSSLSGPATPVIAKATSAGERAFRHRCRDLRTNRSERVQKVRRDAERRGLVLLGVGDEAAMQEFGCARRFGQRRRQQSGRARFSRDDAEAAFAGQREHPFGDRGQVLRQGSDGHGP